ncbi:AlpA family phage regulatory protein [Marichromatium bheemlicum]|uniref:AlpA family phage regulatory protein n=1 Tax=Marichromatium bheemlicum TaxID=365339 RepID=A0ABX1IA28_9GAMM|nr:AlpA family phage regulatory protein [Marichromatium bheemlicum]
MTATPNTRPKTIIRRTELEKKLGLSRSTIYGKLKLNPKRPGEYDPTFPRPIPIGAKAVGWILEEVEAWLEAQAAKRRGLS